MRVWRSQQRLECANLLTCWRFCSRHGRIRSELACARGKQRRQVAALQTLARLRNSRVWADAGLCDALNRYPS